MVTCNISVVCKWLPYIIYNIIPINDTQFQYNYSVMTVLLNSSFHLETINWWAYGISSQGRDPGKIVVISPSSELPGHQLSKACTTGGVDV